MPALAKRVCNSVDSRSSLRASSRWMGSHKSAAQPPPGTMTTVGSPRPVHKRCSLCPPTSIIVPGAGCLRPSRKLAKISMTKPQTRRPAPIPASLITIQIRTVTVCPNVSSLPPFGRSASRTYTIGVSAGKSCVAPALYLPEDRRNRNETPTRCMLFSLRTRTSEFWFASRRTRSHRLASSGENMCDSNRSCVRLSSPLARVFTIWRYKFGITAGC
jgi:hypothetical protein